jgi:methylmalonyl-CoA/ethylmalonyl-CoA epimerase
VRAVLFDHIAIAVPRLADADAVLAGQLGGRSTFGATTDEYRFRHWRYEGGGDLEVLEPVGANGFLHRFLAQRGPGIHHVTFTVPNLDDACDRARVYGYSIVGYDGSDPQWKEAFLHPREAQGIVVQLAETNVHQPGEPANDTGSGGHPTANPPPIRVLGLRLRARSHVDANTQWGTVLRGQRVDRGVDDLVFRWPGSFMQVTVEIDPRGDEGPLCIDYATRRPVALPDGAHPVLGAVFKRRSIDERNDGDSGDGAR